ncbi:MAG: hypothetical protein M1569_01245 [Candidatus Marsarchaeota archaeon]|nr:hypothetical protein [Candidatus Marsarchaeota archaeon]MCL5413014.1 hypothetical protein [Candidatus Marsarchaeota archaeon]
MTKGRTKSPRRLSKGAFSAKYTARVRRMSNAALVASIAVILIVVVVLIIVGSF